MRKLIDSELIRTLKEIIPADDFEVKKNRFIALWLKMMNMFTRLSFSSMSGKKKKMAWSI
jgi:hypothetical protein